MAIQYMSDGGVKKTTEETKKTPEQLERKLTEQELIHTTGGYTPPKSEPKPPATTTTTSSPTTTAAPPKPTTTANDTTKTTSQPKSIQTQIILPNGKKSVGYIINGQTFLDAEGKTRIGEGTTVYTNGGWYKLENGKGVLVDMLGNNNNTAEGDKYTNLVNSILDSGNAKNSSEVYDEFLKMINEKPEIGKVMTDAEAQARARNQFNTSYEKAMKERMRQIDINALRTGFFGQLPTEALKANAAAEIEAQKEGQIQSRASDLVTDSRDEAQRAYTNEMNERNQRAAMLAQAINSYASLENLDLNRLNIAHGIASNVRSQDRQDAILDFEKEKHADYQRNNMEKFEFDKAIAEAGLTGFYNGLPTIQKQQLDDSISQGWARINQIKQDAASAGVELPEISEREYANEIFNMAHDKATSYFKTMYGSVAMQNMMGDEEAMKQYSEILAYFIDIYTNGFGSGSIPGGAYLKDDPAGSTFSNFRVLDYLNFNNNNTPKK